MEKITELMKQKIIKQIMIDLDIDIKEKEPLTAYDLTKDTQYMAKIIYKRSGYNETKI